MDELTLAAIGASTEPPQAPDAPRTAHIPAPDRLSELAAWWDLVHQTGASDPAAPRRVDHFWAPDGAGPATLAVVTPHPWDPPPSLSIPAVIAWATTTADAVIDAGTELVLLSVPVGAGTSTPATLAASLLWLDAVDAVGWPSATGMSDVAWMVQVAAIRDGLQRLRMPQVAPDASTAPDEVLTRLGDTSLAAGCAVLMRCASRRTPLILEGLGSAVCALLAFRASPGSRSWSIAADGPMQAGPTSTRVAPMTGNLLHDKVLAAIASEPLTRLGLSWADGTGVRLGLSMLETAVNRETR